ncbi:MAG: hypothetical protein M3O30_10015 [Planctomycetota bacterium]|nr:hypothetical protein [Planctomycetota bacterium]
MRVMNRTIALLGIAALLLGVTGCHSGVKSYDVIVTNRLSEPVTVWLTENEQPYDAGFASPEEIAMTKSLDAPLEGRVIAAGMTGETKKTAEISKNNQPVLRIYRADHLAAILALSVANPGRMDMPLMPGITDIDVLLKDDQLIIQNHAPRPEPTTQP